MTRGVRWLRFVWEDRILVLACAATAVLVTAAYTLSVRPRYEAVAEIEIESTPPRPTDASWWEAEARRALSTPVLTRLASKYELTGTPELQGGPLRTPLERLRARLRETAPAPVEEPAVASLRSRIRARPNAPKGRLVLTVRAHDPRFAALAANGLARVFAEDAAGMAADRQGEAAGWLESRLAVATDGAAAAPGPEAPGSEATQDQAERRLAEARERAVTSSSEAAETRRRADALRRSTEAEILDALEGAAGDAARSARQVLAETEARRADLEQSLGPRHPDVVTIHDWLRRQREALAAEAARVVREAEAAAAAAEREAAEARRERDAAARALAALGEGRAMDPVSTPATTARPVEEVPPTANAGPGWRVAAVATPPTRAASPNVQRNLAFGAASGLFLGLTLALVRASTRR